MEHELYQRHIHETSQLVGFVMRTKICRRSTVDSGTIRVGSDARGEDLINQIGSEASDGWSRVHSPSISAT